MCEYGILNYEQLLLLVLCQICLVTIWPHVSCKRHVSIFIPYSWGTRELLYTLLLTSKVRRSESTWDILTFKFSLCVALKFRHGEIFFSLPNFHWLFMVVRYLFWCYDDGVLTALTILFVLALSTLLVIMLTNFSFILYTNARRQFFKSVTQGSLTTDISCC